MTSPASTGPTSTGPASTDPTVAAGRRPWWRRALRSPFTHLVLALVVIALVQGLFVKVYQVPSSSMEPTLVTAGWNSDRILVNRLAYGFGGTPEVGDVIVFDAPETWSAPVERSFLRTAVGAVGDLVGFGPSNQHVLVKRVLAVGGQTLECCSADGRLLLDGQPLDEEYLGTDLPYEAGVLDCTTTPASTRCFPPITVPEGELLVLGDNRANSSDSVASCRLPDAVAPGCARFVPIDRVIGEAFLVLYPFDRWGQRLSVD